MTGELDPGAAHAVDALRKHAEDLRIYLTIWAARDDEKAQPDVRRAAPSIPRSSPGGLLRRPRAASGPLASRVLLPSWKAPSLVVAGVGSEASRRCSPHCGWPFCHGDPDRNPGMTEARAGRVQSEMKTGLDSARVRALCAQGS